MIRVSLCQRNKARGIFTWYARIFDTETKDIRYESLGTTRKTEAFELMCEKKKSGDYENKFRDMTTLGRVVELYEKDCESRGSNALRAGVNPKTLQKLLRHSCITTTLNIYTHLIDEDLTEEIEKMFR